MTFLILWIGFKVDATYWRHVDTLYFNLGFMGLLVMVETWIQYHRDWVHADGHFPVNPIFNAAWLSCVGIFLVGKALPKVSSRKPSQEPSEPTLAIRDRPWSAYFLLATGFMMIVTAIAGPARSVLLALSIGFCYLAYPYLTTRRIIVLLTILLIAACVIPKQAISRRFRTYQENYRTNIWSIALHGTGDHPWFGYGLGNFDMIYQRYAFPVETDSIRFARSTSFAHCEYLQIASELGVLPFLIILVGTLTVLRRRTSRSLSSSRPAKAALMVLVPIAGINFIWHSAIILFLTLVWSAFLLYEGSPERYRKSVSSPFMLVAFALILTSTECALGWCALRDRWANQGNWHAIVQYAPQDALAWKNLGLQQTNWQSAAQALSIAAMLAPNDLYIHEDLAADYEASNQRKYLPLSIEEYEQALKASPNRAFDALSVGRNLYKLKLPRAALPWLFKARLIEPNYWESDLWIARCWLAIGDPEKAISVLKALKTRRLMNALWRNKILLDFPSGNTPAPYDQTILAFDESVFDRELAFSQHALQTQLQRH